MMTRRFTNEESNMALAYCVAQRSHISPKKGAVIVDVADCVLGMGCSKTLGKETGDFVIPAEVKALMCCRRDPRASAIYMTHMPTLESCALLIENGVKRIFVPLIEFKDAEQDLIIQLDCLFTYAALEFATVETAYDVLSAASFMALPEK